MTCAFPQKAWTGLCIDGPWWYRIGVGRSGGTLYRPDSFGLARREANQVGESGQAHPLVSATEQFIPIGSPRGNVVPQQTIRVIAARGRMQRNNYLACYIGNQLLSRAADTSHSTQGLPAVERDIRGKGSKPPTIYRAVWAQAKRSRGRRSLRSNTERRYSAIC
jgi:hypothetical protein